MNRNLFKRQFPNILTFSRGGITIALLIVFWQGTSSWLWSALILLAALTDWFDGYLARRWGVQTDFGAIYDAFFDKPLIWSTFYMVAVLSPRAIWLTPIVLLICRDFLTDNFKGYLKSRGVIVAASNLAKVKTVLEFVFVLIYFTAFGFNWTWLYVVAWLCLMAAVYCSYRSGWGYLQRFQKLFSQEANPVAVIFLSFGLAGFHFTPRLVWIIFWSSILWLLLAWKLPLVMFSFWFWLLLLGLSWILFIGLEWFGRRIGTPVWLALDKVIGVAIVGLFYWHSHQISSTSLAVALTIYWVLAQLADWQNLFRSFLSRYAAILLRSSLMALIAAICSLLIEFMIK